MKTVVLLLKKVFYILVPRSCVKKSTKNGDLLNSEETDSKNIDSNYAFSLTHREKTQVDEAIGVLRTVLMPKLVDLDGVDIKKMVKMGNKTVAFVEKSVAYMEQNPELIPAYISLDDMKTDMEGLSALSFYKAPLEQVVDMISDSAILSGSELYAATLAFYNSVKEAAKAGAPGADDIYNDLKTRFQSKQ